MTYLMNTYENCTCSAYLVCSERHWGFVSCWSPLEREEGWTTCSERYPASLEYLLPTAILLESTKRGQLQVTMTRHSVMTVQRHMREPTVQLWINTFNRYLLKLQLSEWANSGLWAVLDSLGHRTGAVTHLAQVISVALFQMKHITYCVMMPTQHNNNTNRRSRWLVTEPVCLAMNRYWMPSSTPRTQWED